MTISATANETTYNADGVSVAFAIPFPFDTSDDIKVLLTDSVTGAVTPLSSGFSIVGGGGSPGTALFLAAPAATLKVTLLDDPALTQPTDYVDLDAFPAESHERALDRVTRLCKRLHQQWLRTIRFTDADLITDGSITSTVNRRGKYLFFNAITGAVEYATAIIGNTLSQSIIGQYLNPQSAAEITVGVTPTNYAYAPGNPWRYGADGTGGANDTAALLTAANVVAAMGTGVNGWRNGTPNGFLLQTAAETAANILPVNFNYPPLDARRYGYAADNNPASADANVTALKNAITVAAAAVSGATGATVDLPTGIAYVSSPIVLPNRVRLKGINCSGSLIKATSGFSATTPIWSGSTDYVVADVVLFGGNTYSCIQPHTNHVPPNSTYWSLWPVTMFWAHNGVTAMFDSILQDLFIDCSSVGGLGAVLTDAWQENCGLRNVGILNFRTVGVRFRNVSAGGQSTCEIQGCQLFPANVAGTVAGIQLDQISSVGAFMLHVRDSVIAGSAGNPCAKGINIVNDSLNLDNVHFEGCTDAVYLAGVGASTIKHASGLAGMTSLVHVDSGFTGRLNMIDCQRNGATNFVKNDAEGKTYTSPDLALYVYPGIESRNTSKAWGVFDGTTTGTNPPAAGFNVTSVQRTGAGRYTVTMTNALLSSNYAPMTNSNLGSASKVEWTSVIGPTSFTININVAGVATDASEIKFVVFGS